MMISSLLHLASSDLGIVIHDQSDIRRLVGLLLSYYISIKMGGLSAVIILLWTKDMKRKEHEGAGENIIP